MVRKAAASNRKLKPANDMGESTSEMMPALISDESKYRGELDEKVLELTQKSLKFKASLPIAVVEPLATLVRTMNCYYSNLIEGGNTKPIDIERALHGDYSDDPEKRDLQLEAKAHVSVQAWIDEGGVTGRSLTVDGLMEIHRRFFEQVPEELRWTKSDKHGNREKVVPGETRNCRVEVGRHLPPSAGSVPRFLTEYERIYAKLGPAAAVRATAAAHHRLLWIHPFVDGNGRVARLVSHAVMLEALDTGGLWSISRGLARKVDTYKSLLAACDLKRRNDLDGRGNLSEEELINFTKFFMDACIDQVDYMADLMKPDALRRRILRWVRDEEDAKRLPSMATRVMEILLHVGQLERKDVQTLLGVQERQTARIMSALQSAEAIKSAHTRAPWTINLSARLAPAWVPSLYDRD
jgi:Fic family protein